MEGHRQVMGPRSSIGEGMLATLTLVLRLHGHVPMTSRSWDASCVSDRTLSLHNSCFVSASESWCNVEKNVSLTYKLPSSSADADDDAGRLRWVLTVRGKTFAVVQRWRLLPEASLREAINDPTVRYCRRFELRDAISSASYHVLALDPSTSVLTGVIHMQPDFSSVPSCVNSGSTSGLNPSTPRLFFANSFIL